MTDLSLEYKIENKFSLLLKASAGFLKPEEEALLRDALEFLKEACGDMKTDYGEHRVCHALNIARIAVEEIGLGYVSIVSCLFHDLLLYDRVKPDAIRKQFGQPVYRIVAGFAKLSELPTDRVILQSESFRKLFLAVVDDIRIILIKIAHRLHDMRNIEDLPPEKQQRFHNEVVHIYIPTAHRLGLYTLKKELEDRSMKFLNPETYQEIAQKIRDTEARRNAFINEFTSPIVKELNAHGFKFDIKGRPKSISSIWNKMKKQDVAFEQVYDLFAVRIILESPPESEKADCWRVYSIVTNIYTPNPKRLRDWISTPKASGYESLHTTVKGPKDRWVEVQIRTRNMDELAEKGQAAHWRYKGFDSKKDSEVWLEQVRDILENPAQIDFDDLHATKKTQRPDKVYAFTPDGDLKELNSGATVLDFAFEIHTNVGHSCTGAKINGKIAQLKQKLKNGDKVEILTSKSQQPKLDWLNIATTSRARNKIKRALKEDKFQAAEKGNEILRRKFRNWKIDFSDVNIDKLIKKYKLSSSIDLYSLVYEEKLDLLDIKRFLQEGGTPPGQVSGAPEKIQETEGKGRKVRKSPGDVLRISKNLDKVNYHLARCCNPIPGDPVFGFVTISKGITIHRKNCPNARQLLSRYHYRAIPVEWKDNEDTNAFTTVINVSGVDKVGMMNEISEVVSNDLKVNMISVKIDSGQGIFNGTIKLVVRNTSHLDELLHRLEGISGVTKAIRIG